jgi:hypothetical protein
MEYFDDFMPLQNEHFIDQKRCLRSGKRPESLSRIDPVGVIGSLQSEGAKETEEEIELALL